MNKPNRSCCLECSNPSRIWSFFAAKSWSVGSCFWSTEGRCHYCRRSRTADFAWLHRERHRSLARHAADVRHLSIGKHEVAGLDGRAQFLGSFLQVVPEIARSDSSCVFWLSRMRALVLELAIHFRTDLFECGGRRRGLQPGQPLPGSAVPCRVVLRPLCVTRVHELRRCAQFGNTSPRPTKWVVTTFRFLPCCGRLVQQRVARRLHHPTRLLLANQRLNLAFHFIEGLEVRLVLSSV